MTYSDDIYCVFDDISGVFHDMCYVFDDISNSALYMSLKYV
jgi:hypothetical protein